MVKADAATLSATGSDGAMEKVFRWQPIGYPGISCKGSINVTMTVQFPSNTRTTKCDGTMVASASVIINTYHGKVTFKNSGATTAIISIQWGLHGTVKPWPYDSVTVPASNRCSVEYNPSLKTDGVLHQQGMWEKIITGMEGNGELTLQPSHWDSISPYIVNPSNPNRRWYYILSGVIQSEPGYYKSELKAAQQIGIYMNKPEFSGSYHGTIGITISCN